MRNLKASRIDASEFIGNVIESKRPRDDKGYKPRCRAIHAEIADRIRDFDTAFHAGNLEIFDKEKWESGRQKDLTSLYKYSQKPFRLLRDSVICDEHNRRDGTCPLCDIDQVGTLDHFLPKEHFASFVVHPRNLIPCCSTCNDHKSSCWHENGYREVWNAYLNELPGDQYLFCDITIADGLPVAAYRIEQGNISDNDFALIRRTFARLHLIERYNVAASRVIAKSLNIYSAHIKSCIKYSFEENINLLKEIESTSGIINNWEHVLKMSLLQSQPVVELLRHHTAG